jgi:hypothetical protein
MSKVNMTGDNMTGVNMTGEENRWDPTADQAAGP